MADPKLRLFTALSIPHQFKEQLQDLPRHRLEGKWTHADDLHITLRYLGPVEGERVLEIEDALGRVQRPAFGVVARGLSYFANRRQTILYADIDSTRKITTLVAEISDRLLPLGFDFGTRPYVPHITLARCPKRAPVDEFAARHQGRIGSQWQAPCFHLMQSGTPDEAGRNYRILSSYELAP